MFMRDEELILPIEKRTADQQRAFYTQYLNMAFSGSNMEVDSNTALKIFAELKKLQWNFLVFKDVMPTLKDLKSRGLILGLISNTGKDMSQTYEKLKLDKYIDSFTNSLEAGYDNRRERYSRGNGKMRRYRAGAIFVGDQYEIDIVGARNSNMLPLLIDRNNWFTNIKDCARITSLTEITRFL
jgi:putative hydrolase of the HAD superfamily